MNFFLEIYDSLFYTGLGDSLFGTIPLHFLALFLTVLVVFMPIIFIYAIFRGFYDEY